VSDPIAGVAGENDAGLPTEGVVGEGLSRLFTFDSGDSLFSRIAAGEITTTAELMAALEELAGAGNVINHGDDTMPRIELHLTKTLTGHGGLDVAFDQFGGHAEFQGELAVSVDVHLNVVFGIDAGGAFYLETNGTSPEVVFDNIQVNGSLEGEGRLGFLGVTLENGRHQREQRQHLGRPDWTREQARLLRPHDERHQRSLDRHGGRRLRLALGRSRRDGAATGHGRAVRPRRRDARDHLG